MGRLVGRYQVKAFARGYQAGLEAIFALVIAAGIGFWIDTRTETMPLFLLVGMALGFGACVLRLLRYQRELDARPRQGERSEGGAHGDDATD